MSIWHVLSFCLSPYLLSRRKGWRVEAKKRKSDKKYEEIITICVIQFGPLPLIRIERHKNSADLLFISFLFSACFSREVIRNGIKRRKGKNQACVISQQETILRNCFEKLRIGLADIKYCSSIYHAHKQKCFSSSSFMSHWKKIDLP